MSPQLLSKICLLGLFRAVSFVSHVRIGVRGVPWGVRDKKPHLGFWPRCYFWGLTSQGLSLLSAAWWRRRHRGKSPGVPQHPQTALQQPFALTQEPQKGTKGGKRDSWGLPPDAFCVLLVPYSSLTSTSLSSCPSNGLASWWPGLYNSQGLLPTLPSLPPSSGFLGKRNTRIRRTVCPPCRVCMDYKIILFLSCVLSDPTTFLHSNCTFIWIKNQMLKTQQKKESYCSFQYLTCQEPGASGKLNQLLKKFPSFQLFSRKVGGSLQPIFPKKKKVHTRQWTDNNKGISTNSALDGRACLEICQEHRSQLQKASWDCSWNSPLD